MFDAAVVIVSVVGMVVDVTTPDTFAFLPVLRALRVLRTLRLVPKWRGLQALLRTLYFSLPALANVGSVLLLLMYVYAVIGMGLFGQVRGLATGGGCSVCMWWGWTRQLLFATHTSPLLDCVGCLKEAAGRTLAISNGIEHMQLAFARMRRSSTAPA